MVKEEKDSRLSTRVIPKDKTVKAAKPKVEFVRGCPDCEKGAPHTWLMNSYECGCQVTRDSAGGYFITWCLVHKAAPVLYAALKELLNYGVEFDDTRLDYVVAHLDKDAIAEARAALALVEEENHGK